MSGFFNIFAHPNARFVLALMLSFSAGIFFALWAVGLSIYSVHVEGDTGAIETSIARLWDACFAMLGLFGGLFAGPALQHSGSS